MYAQSDCAFRPCQCALLTLYSLINLITGPPPPIFLLVLSLYFTLTKVQGPSSNSKRNSPPEPHIILPQPLFSRHDYNHCRSHSNLVAAHLAVVGSTCPAEGIPAVGSRLAGNKAAVGSSVRCTGRRLGRREGDKWGGERSSAVASFWGCVCAEQKREEAY